MYPLLAPMGASDDYVSVKDLLARVDGEEIRRLRLQLFPFRPDIRHAYSFTYNFHPVGQGLFASGAIYSSEGHSPRFVWVYDCGTSSAQTLLMQRQADFREQYEGRGYLNLVTISHFDKDHISGIPSLLSAHRVDTVLLPFLPLWKRLVVAFGEGVPPDGDLMGFFINPAGYLVGLPGSEINRIVFVLPGGQADVPQGSDAPVKSGGPDGGWGLDFEEDRPDDSGEVEALSVGTAKTQVRFLKRGGRLQVAGLWEFVPYNDDLEEDISLSFQTAVRAERHRLLTGTSVGERAAALAELKVLYDRHFGSTSEKRNVISLFLYAGPIYPTWKASWFGSLVRWGADSSFFQDLRWFACHLDPALSDQCGMLYTGDGYLDTSARLARMTGYFGALRISRTGALQVMHHGARRNWHKGVAQAINPFFSVFCSDPKHKGLCHPHAPVLRDFWAYQPVQVDKSFGATLQGWLRMK
jgi:hypothetical protein